VRRNTVIGPRDELPKLSIAQSPGPIDPLCLLYGFTAELQEGTTTKIHQETKNRFTTHHHRIQARFFWEFPIPEVRGAFGFSEGGDEVLSKMGNRGGITFLTPKFSIFETALRTRTSHPFIGGVPGRHLSFAQACRRLCGSANPKAPSPSCYPAKVLEPFGKWNFGGYMPGRGLLAWWGPQRKMDGK
jgi:hypothetical protein